MGSTQGKLLSAFLVGCMVLALSASNVLQAKASDSPQEIEEVVPCRLEWQLNPKLNRGQVKLLQKGAEGLTKAVYNSSRNVSAITPEIYEIGIKNSIMQTQDDMKFPRQELLVQATAYTHTGNATFTGVYPHVGTIAVDPAVIPLGTRLWIEGYGYGIAQDTGGLIKGKIIDLFMDQKSECLKWGRRKVKVYLLE